MKFSCDNCGAQYLIADEKLGARGVKVRCKKCSEVIVLRPAGYKGGGTGDLPRDEPAGSRMGGSAASTDAQLSGVGLGTSSELGVSQEFAALGFEDGHRSKNPLSFGVDMGAMEEEDEDSSPFSTDRTGGSLSLLNGDPPRPEVPPASIRTSVGPAPPDVREESGPRGAADDDRTMRLSGSGAVDRNEETRVDFHALPGNQMGGELSAGAGRGELDDATQAAPLETPWPASEDDEDEDGDGPGAIEGAFDPAPRASSFGDEDEPLASVPAAAGVGGDEPAWPAGRDSSPGEGSWGGGWLPSAEMGGSLGGGARAASTAPIERPVSDNDTKDDEDEESLSALSALGGATLGDSDRTPPSRPAPGADASAFLGSQIDSELGSAFDAVFASKGVEKLERRSGSAAAPSQADRVETRLFDADASAQVEAEQALATAPRKKDLAEWYVAIDDEQVGPLTLGEVQDKWEAGNLEPNSLCWRQGMADWTAIRFAPELELLGTTDDRARTVVAQIEPSGREPEEAAEDRASDSGELADRGGSVRPTDEPPVVRTDSDVVWRPSAASALASLAASELGGGDAASPGSKKIADGAVMGPLPATSDALEKLLSGGAAGPERTASRFGAAELSQSAVRPLPRGNDSFGPSPLRDPVGERNQNNLVKAAVVLGSFVLFTGVIIASLLFAFRKDDEGGRKAAAATGAPVKVALASPPAEPARASPGVQPTAGIAAPSAEAASPTSAAAPAFPDRTAAPAEEAARPAPGAPEEPGSEVVKEEPDRPPETAKGQRAKESKRQKRERERNERDRDREKRSKPARDREAKPAEPPPRAAPPPAEATPPPAGTVEDDLLGIASRRSRPAAEADPAMPKQLDDSDILGVMRKHRGDVRTCLEQQAAADPALDGALTVKLVITGSGKATRISVEPDKFKSSVVGRCVASAVQRWSFPPFSGPNMPIDFPVHVRGR